MRNPQEVPPSPERMCASLASRCRPDSRRRQRVSNWIHDEMTGELGSVKSETQLPSVNLNSLLQVQSNYSAQEQFYRNNNKDKSSNIFGEANYRRAPPKVRPMQSPIRDNINRDNYYETLNFNRVSTSPAHSSSRSSTTFNKPSRDDRNRIDIVISSPQRYAGRRLNGGGRGCESSGLAPWRQNSMQLSSSFEHYPYVFRPDVFQEYGAESEVVRDYWRRSADPGRPRRMPTNMEQYSSPSSTGSHSCRSNYGFGYMQDADGGFSLSDEITRFESAARNPQRVSNKIEQVDLYNKPPSPSRNYGRHREHPDLANANYYSRNNAVSSSKTSIETNRMQNFKRNSSCEPQSPKRKLDLGNASPLEATEEHGLVNRDNQSDLKVSGTGSNSQKLSDSGKDTTLNKLKKTADTNSTKPEQSAPVKVNETSSVSTMTEQINNTASPAAGCPLFSPM